MRSYSKLQLLMFVLSSSVLVSCSGGACNVVNTPTPIPTPTPIIPSQIIASYVGESTLTQAGGSSILMVKLSESLPQPQEIILLGLDSYDEGFTWLSNPNPCVLQSTESSCQFNIITNDRTRVGKHTFQISANAESTNLLESNVTLSVIPPYKFYFAHNGESGYNANLLAQATSKGATNISTGIQGADYLCNHDESKPYLPESAIYKAMIVDGVNRQACYSFNCVFEGIDENIDWVMYPNAAYKNLNESIVFVTNESGIYIFVPDPNLPTIWTLSDSPMIYLPDDFTIDYGVAFMWSGLSSVWTMYPPISATNNGLCSQVVAGHTFGYWNSDSNISSGNVGTQTSYAPLISAIPSLSPTQIAAGSRSCAESALVSINSTYINGLICVQQ